VRPPDPRSRLQPSRVLTGHARKLRQQTWPPGFRQPLHARPFRRGTSLPGVTAVLGPRHSHC